MFATLNDFIATNLFVFLMIFARIGSAFVVMPGIGDTFVSPQIRLCFALVLCFVSMPLLGSQISLPPENTGLLVSMIATEFVIGIFIGTVARILATSMATAGNLIALQSGLGNAQIFNPMVGGGSVIGSLLTLFSVTMLFTTDLHHLLILSVFKSYQLFPFGSFPQTGDMAQTITDITAYSFTIGFQIAVPFILVATVVNLTLGILARLLPQVHIFFVSLPIQITLTLFILAIVLTTAINYWLAGFENHMISFLQNY